MASTERGDATVLRSNLRFGSGWISGVSSIALGAIGLGTVICFLFPTLLTVPELRGRYPVAYIRGLLHLVLVSAFLLGVVSVSVEAAADGDGRHRARVVGGLAWGIEYAH